jgi:hypothetical protein
MKSRIYKVLMVEDFEKSSLTHKVVGRNLKRKAEKQIAIAKRKNYVK